MDYAELRVLEAVARNGSMNRAAAELHMVQSNVTARVRSLEQQVGTALFRRTSRGVVLTAAGERLLPYAERLGALLREARQVARDDGTPRGMLRIGALETTAALRLPPILAAYAQAYPEVGLVVTTGTSAGLVADVMKHRLDAALVAGPVDDAVLSEEPIFREELMLISAPSLYGLDQLHQPRIIVFRHGCSYRQRLEGLLAQRGIQASQTLEFGSLEAILGSVAAGVGVTLLPRAVVASACREGRVKAHELPAAFTPRVTTVLIRRNDAFCTSALAAFLEVAKPAPLALASGD